MNIQCRALGPVQANCYLVTQDGHALIIDPGDKIVDLSTWLDGNELDAILLTHAHFDHIAGLDSILENYPVPVYLHSSEHSFLQDTKLNASAYFYQRVISYAQPKSLVEGPMHIGTFDLKIDHTPGHSIGSCCIRIGECLFTGDTLFQGSCGRIDLPTGSLEQMEQSLARLKKLPPSLRIYPGHGPDSTMEQEKQWNPYLR